ncbi:hypothetical protein L1049_026371 [Liquidambar formosana]|uniref:Uncharacterized protein n=1 Tax=Liquidambar formosana TaxID=63359 RepID=A0AAP0NEU3_LIQFO
MATPLEIINSMHGDFKKMIGILDKAIERQQQRSEGYTNILMMLEEMNHHDEEKLNGENIDFLLEKNAVIDRDDESCVVEEVPKISDDPKLSSTK